MAYTELTTAIQTREMRSLIGQLQNAYLQAVKINSQLDEMSDAQVTAQYGVPAGTVAAFRTNMDGLIAAMEAQAFTNFRTRVGFDAVG